MLVIDKSVDQIAPDQCNEETWMDSLDYMHVHIKEVQLRGYEY